MKQEDKNEIVILIICISIILILIGLTVKISLNAQNYDCNKCYINFETKTPTEKETGIKAYLPINISVKTLYKGYNEEKCPIVWDRSQGYKYGN